MAVPVHTGEVIDGRFVIERFIARGGMGEVYRALDRQTDRPVALKLMAQDDQLMAERFALEARALLELDHPAVVRYVAHGEAPKVGLYLAMEWLDGVTLAGWLRQHSLSLDQTLRLAVRVAEGLGAAHARGMIHRDVKPGNLFLVGKRVEAAKVLDFGLVRNPWQHITATGAGMGTPEYMSPEQARGVRDLSPASDVFALGTVLYRCITGQRAFAGEHAQAVLAKIATFERPPRVADLRADVPAAVDELVAALMAADPAARPPDGAAAAVLIRAARAGVSSSERRVRPSSPTSLTTREQAPAAVLFVDLDAGGDARPGRDRPPSRPPPIAQSSGTVFVVRSPAAPMRRRADDDPEVRQVRELATAISGRVVPLATGALVVTIAGGAAAPELAIRAARLALAIHAAVPGAAISLSTRQVVVADGATGPLIDRAAALPRSPGIRIDQRTRELLPDPFEVRRDDAGGYVLLAEHAPTGEPRLLLGRAMPCVGRQSVLRQMAAIVDGVIEDRAARAVVVVGEAGVGKSRVRDEHLAALRARDVTVITAGGEPLRAGVPGGVLSRAIRGLLGVTDDPGAALRARVDVVVPDGGRERVADFLGELAGVAVAPVAGAAVRAARSDPRFMAEQQRRAVEDWLAAECAARPVALVVDDLQWADAMTVELIEAALRRCRDLPLYVLALARPEVQQRFPKLDAAWARSEIPLEPLRPAAAEQLVREALGADAAPALVARLVEHSGGNPFYLEELIRAAASAEPASLPGSVLASLQLRIASRPPRARLVLRAASVFGRVFWGSGVRALLAGEMEGDEVDEWLGVLVRDELIEARGPSRTFAGEPEYQFHHDLLRDASYQMLTPEDRMSGHRLAGAWLVAHGEADAAVLAEHFAGGGATAQAVTWFQRAAELALAGGAADLAALRQAARHYRRAGETCAAAYANDAAIEHLERATALWSPIDPIEAARTRLALARVREISGDAAGALDDLRAAEEDVVAVDGPIDLRVEILLARAYVEGRSGAEGALDRAIDIGERAVALAHTARVPDLEARAMASLAGAVQRTGEAASVARAVDLAQRALGLAEDRGHLAAALWRLGNAFLAANQLDPASRLYDDALAAAENHRDELLIAHCLGNMGLLAFRRWRLDDAIEHTRRALDQYERVGYQTRILEATLNLGMYHHLRGDTGRGRELLGNVLGQARGDWVLSTLAQETLADAERLAGREARAQARLRAAARMCERVGASGQQALYLGMLAESLWAVGDADAALAALEDGAQASTSLTLSHAHVLLHLGQWDDAREWFERFAETEPDPQRRVSARLGLARAHAWSGRLEDAVAQCAAALATLEASPVPRFVLPVRCLRAALNGDVVAALDALEAVRRVCAPHERGEAALDIGEALVVHGAPDEVLRRYLSLSEEAGQRGVRYRLEDLRSRFRLAIGEVDAARASLALARADLDGLREQLDDQYRRQLDDHPWVRELVRIRAVP